MGRKKVAKCLVDNEKKMQKISYANTCICNRTSGHGIRNSWRFPFVLLSLPLVLCALRVKPSQGSQGHSRAEIPRKRQGVFVQWED